MYKVLTCTGEEKTKQKGEKRKYLKEQQRHTNKQTNKSI